MQRLGMNGGEEGVPREGEVGDEVEVEEVHELLAGELDVLLWGWVPAGIVDEAVDLLVLLDGEVDEVLKVLLLAGIAAAEDASAGAELLELLLLEMRERGIDVRRQRPPWRFWSRRRRERPP